METLFGKMRSLDAYPKINEDFYSRTLSGGVITLVSSIFMFLLFISELSSYLSYLYVYDSRYVLCAQSCNRLLLILVYVMITKFLSYTNFWCLLEFVMCCFSWRPVVSSEKNWVFGFLYLRFECQGFCYLTLSCGFGSK